MNKIMNQMAQRNMAKAAAMMLLMIASMQESLASGEGFVNTTKGCLGEMINGICNNTTLSSNMTGNDAGNKTAEECLGAMINGICNNTTLSSNMTGNASALLNSTISGTGALINSTMGAVGNALDYTFTDVAGVAVSPRNILALAGGLYLVKKFADGVWYMYKSLFPARYRKVQSHELDQLPPLVQRDIKVLQKKGRIVKLEVTPVFVGSTKDGDENNIMFILNNERYPISYDECQAKLQAKLAKDKAEGKIKQSTLQSSARSVQDSERGIVRNNKELAPELAEALVDGVKLRSNGKTLIGRAITKENGDNKVWLVNFDKELDDEAYIKLINNARKGFNQTAFEKDEKSAPSYSRREEVMEESLDLYERSLLKKARDLGHKADPARVGGELGVYYDDFKTPTSFTTLARMLG